MYAVLVSYTQGYHGASLHAVDQATQRFGRVDIVVNNAGIIQVGPMSTTTVEDFATALDVMFWGALYPTLAVLPQMQARCSGHVVNITSVGGMVSVPLLLPYTCAKFAAVGLSEGWRAELGQEGIHVTTVVPGLMRTGSYVQARFQGPQEREFTWFALGSTLPLISMSAERAARQIVRATQRGAAECILSLPANILERMVYCTIGLIHLLTNAAACHRLYDQWRCAVMEYQHI
jgi:short-subunit dehydrogenase